MNWYRFIFSEDKFHRIQRHVLFWLLWWMYFSASYFHYEQAGLQKIKFEPWNLTFLIKSVLLLSIHIIACYWFTNYLMPKYLFLKRYKALAAQILALGTFVLIASYFLHKTIFPLINNAFSFHPVFGNQNIMWTSITSGILSAPKIVTAAAAVKLLKRWYLKQKEKERLEQEKLVTDLQLLKAQIHPDFLFSSLDNIGRLVQKKDSNTASALLLKLADILSYMLYECDNPLVPLDKEIKVIKDYVVLQKTFMTKELEIDIAEKGDTTDKLIAPLLLLPFVENSLVYMSNEELETNWFNLEFHVQGNDFTMKLIYGKSSESNSVASEDAVMANATRRLEFFYPNRYQLKKTTEPEMVMISLTVAQTDTITKNEDLVYTEDLDYAIA